MALPKRELTKDGFEMQLGTNHFGHFAFLVPLLPHLKAQVGCAAPRASRRSRRRDTLLAWIVRGDAARATRVGACRPAGMPE